MKELKNEKINSGCEYKKSITIQHLILSLLSLFNFIIITTQELCSLPLPLSLFPLDLCR